MRQGLQAALVAATMLLSAGGHRLEGAEPGPFPFAGVSVLGVRITQSYAADATSTADQPTLQVIRHGSDEPVLHVSIGSFGGQVADPWAHSQLQVHLGLTPRHDWIVLTSTLVDASAVLDSGETVAALPAAPGALWATAGTQVLTDTLYPGTAAAAGGPQGGGPERFPWDLTLACPQAPAGAIRRLPLRLRLTLAQLSTVQTQTITPQPGTAVAIAGLEGGSLQVLAGAQGQVTWTSSPGSLLRVAGVHYLSANGVRLHTFGAATTQNLSAKTIQLVTTVVPQALATIEVQTYAEVRSALVETTLSDLPVLGKPAHGPQLQAPQRCQEDSPGSSPAAQP